ncbi:TraR/DksA family transcriptional regulator [Parasphingorhabdus pacifica]
MTGKTPQDGSSESRTARELLAEERAGALARIESLQRHLTSIREVSTWTGTDDEHDPEGATIAYERAQVQGLLTDARRELEALERAATRLKEGTYGVCERCGNTIAPERLEALPATTTCITCATHR